MEKTFGKLPFILVEKNQQMIYQRGDIEPMRMQWDGKMRQRGYL
jgi:hypothetical protein